MRRDPSYRGPLLGALLRMAHREVIDHIDESFARRGYPALQPTVTQPLFDHPGMRLTELAALAGVSKQAIAEMVQAMIRAGYVEQRPDPSDGRARILRLTARGRRVGVYARELVHEVEARWEREHGREVIAGLRDALHKIVESGQQRRRAATTAASTTRARSAS